MGNFRVEIDSVGGHGCDRGAKEGENIVFNNNPDHIQYCPDCKVRKLVMEFVNGWPGTRAKLIHWPGEPSEVVDDLVAGKRAKGHF